MHFKFEAGTFHNVASGLHRNDEVLLPDAFLMHFDPCALFCSQKVVETKLDARSPSVYLVTLQYQIQSLSKSSAGNVPDMHGRLH